MTTRYIPGTLIEATLKTTQGRHHWEIMADDWKPEYAEPLERLGWKVNARHKYDKGWHDYFEFGIGRTEEVTIYRDFGGKGLSTTRRYVSMAAAAYMECQIAREIDGWTNTKSRREDFHRYHGCPRGFEAGCLCGTPEAAMYYALPAITDPANAEVTCPDCGWVYVRGMGACPRRDCQRLALSGSLTLVAVA